ncbi:MAG: hypothetical protein ACRDGJ_00410 [Candidatus Limnocylindria bacterium]
MDWPALRRFADAIGSDGRVRLLRILGASEEDRSAGIGLLHAGKDRQRNVAVRLRGEEAKGCR